jgi:hypothetical protein
MIAHSGYFARRSCRTDGGKQQRVSGQRMEIAMRHINRIEDDNEDDEPVDPSKPKPKPQPPPPK